MTVTDAADYIEAIYALTPDEPIARQLASMLRALGDVQVDVTVAETEAGRRVIVSSSEPHLDLANGRDR